MHLGLAILSVMTAFKWADWKHWKKYHPTMLFMAVGAFLYEYLTKDQTMWKFHPDFLYNHTVTVVVYAIATMPLNIFLFLSRLPERGFWKKSLHVAIWTAIYSLTEWAMVHTGRISYQNNWSLLYSILFDLMMFPMMILHHRRPVTAYLFSIVIVCCLLHAFEVELE
ncbi:hypothetical protein GXP70_14345 [Paenibacillus lycopersici]|uniref:Uncharacterized protein n=2 Tax=Paenibacillus lycopersici TaxID=2704462 RepID=A0A6C0FZR2_9BACL|nr:hypothetical protein GXP70_14345 [Paenibacillus lycopersici]